MDASDYCAALNYSGEWGAADGAGGCDSQRVVDSGEEVGVAEEGPIVGDFQSGGPGVEALGTAWDEGYSRTGDSRGGEMDVGADARGGRVGSDLSVDDVFDYGDGCVGV